MIEVASVISNKETAAPCEDVTFTAITNPSGYGNLIWWNGGIPDEGHGSTFTKHWPCIGEKTVTATCCTSSCTNNKSKNVTITLPSGCEAGSAEVSFDINIVGVTYNKCNTYCGSACGYTGLVGGVIDPTVEIEAVYNDCKWVFQVYAVQDVESGACTGVHPCFISISGGGDPFLTEDNYCAIVHSMKTGTGCTCIDSSMYTNHNCATIHENFHASYFHALLQDIAEYFLAIMLPNPDPINCNDPTTITCQAVESYHSSSIEDNIVNEFTYAWYDLMQFSESGAIEAARPCFESVADDICDYALSHSWTHCEDCGD